MIPAMWPWFALVFGVGVLVAFQAPINNFLGRELGDPVWGLFVSFTVGLVCATLVLAFTRPDTPERAQFTGLPWWAWLGGVLGTFFVMTAILSIREIGPTGFVMMIVLGQATASLIIDHYGWFDLERTPMSWMRVLGVGVMVIGFWLTQKHDAA